MKSKLFTSFILILSFINLEAQNFRFDYQLMIKEDSLSNESVNKNMVLLFQDGESKFLSETEYNEDSLRSNGLKSAGISDKSLLVINSKENISFKYYFYFKDIYRIEEFVELKWDLKPETKKVGDFLCRKATVEYKGRAWQAWFTQDIPIQAGPYVFRNLPGLIVYIRDSTGSYEFNLTSIKKLPTTFGFKNLYPEAINISQKQLQKVMLDYYNDPLREMKSQNETPVFIDENGKEVKPDFREITKTIQNRLIKYNNPIDLSEALKY